VLKIAKILLPKFAKINFIPGKCRRKYEQYRCWAYAFLYSRRNNRNFWGAFVYLGEEKIECPISNVECPMMVSLCDFIN